MQYKSYCW